MIERILRSLSALLALIVLASLAVGVGGTTGYAMQAQPPTDASYYVRTTSNQTLYTLGCNQGNFDKSFNPPANSQVILDFGGQNSTNTGTNLTDVNYTPVTYSQVETMAEQFAKGYYICTGPGDTTSVLYLSVGTNNSNYYVNYTGGNTWQGVATAIQTWVNNYSCCMKNQVSISAANDIEPGYSSQAAAIDWVNGYSSSSSAPPYFNYGCACGCPTGSHSNGGCNNAWNQYGIWYVSWDQLPAYPLPEVYWNPPPGYASNANQWEQIALYGLQYQAWAGLMGFRGPLDQYPLATNSNTAAQAWSQLWNALNCNGGTPCSTAQSMPFSLEINVAS